MRFTTLALGSLLTAAAVSAHAAYTTIDYTGVVSRVHAATSGPDGPADIVVGLPVTFTATFDASKFVEFSPHLVDHATGAAIQLQTGGATIYDDPLASYTITIGSHVFTQATDDGDGFVNPVNGAGPFPFVSYAGSTLLGIEADSIVDGFEFTSSPGGFLLEEHRHVGNGYFTADGDYFFQVNTSLDAGILAAREQGLEAAAVPEPSSWALMLAGVGALAWSRRQSTRSATSASPRT